MNSMGHHRTPKAVVHQGQDQLPSGCTLTRKGGLVVESTHLSPIWPGFKSQLQSHIWVEFVVGSLSCYERFFSVHSDFPLSSKPNTSKFQFDLEHTDMFKQVYKNS